MVVGCLSPCACRPLLLLEVGVGGAAAAGCCCCCSRDTICRSMHELLQGGPVVLLDWFKLLTPALPQQQEQQPSTTAVGTAAAAAAAAATAAELLEPFLAVIRLSPHHVVHRVSPRALSGDEGPPGGPSVGPPKNSPVAAAEGSRRQQQQLLQQGVSLGYLFLFVSL